MFNLVVFHTTGGEWLIQREQINNCNSRLIRTYIVNSTKYVHHLIHSHLMQQFCEDFRNLINIFKRNEMALGNSVFFLKTLQANGTQPNSKFYNVVSKWCEQSCWINKIILFVMWKWSLVTQICVTNIFWFKFSLKIKRTFFKSEIVLCQWFFIEFIFQWQLFNSVWPKINH